MTWLDANKWFILAVIALVLSVVVFNMAFSWLVFEPSQVYRACSGRTGNNFDQCLHQNGLR